VAILRSGELSATIINGELGRGLTTCFSIDFAENGNYGRINQKSFLRPNPDNPAAYSEWYGYAHSRGGGGGPTDPEVEEITLSFGGSNQTIACGGGPGRTIYFDGESQWWNRPIFTNTAMTIYAQEGWYSDQPYARGFSVRYWGGSSWSSEPSLCPF
jgi:hypothetical protein